MTLPAGMPNRTPAASGPPPSNVGLRRPGGGRRFCEVAVALAVAAAIAPAPADAQFGPIDALASRVSDLSFFFSTGGIAGGSPELESEAFGLKSFGVELLFEVAEVPTAAARRRLAEAGDSTRAVLRSMEVVRSESGVDTVYHYDIQRVRPSLGDDDILWTLEVGIGYGQVEGLQLSDPGLDLNTSLRLLPSLTLYLTYEPVGTYVGLRTGFMRTDALQVTDAEGARFGGEAEAFMFGAVGGYAFALDPTFLFIEGGYTLQNFPSVEWSGEGPLPAGVPRDLDASAWLLTAGIQFPIR